MNRFINVFICSNPIDNVISETTIEDKDESSSSAGLLLSDQATLVIPRAISVPHQQILDPSNTATLVHHHQPQHQQHHEQQPHTITYHNYTVHPINSINTLNAINTAGTPTVHTINTTVNAINTINTLHPHQQTYELASIQPRNGAQFDTHFRTPKITNVSAWYQ